MSGLAASTAGPAGALPRGLAVAERPHAAHGRERQGSAPGYPDQPGALPAGPGGRDRAQGVARDGRHLPAARPPAARRRRHRRDVGAGARGDPLGCFGAGAHRGGGRGRGALRPGRAPRGLALTRQARISVAIATRDRPQALARCLESLRANRVQPAEVVVADQSSGAETRSVVAAAGVRWVAGGDDGLAGGQNAAFRHATMPLIAVLDDDCVADAGWIEELERAFSADPELALLGGRVLALPGAGERRFAVASRTSTQRRAFSRPSVPWRVGSGNNFALRQEWFEHVGGCDERLGPGTPGQGALDIDLFYRVL